jgi:serine/threonine protein kinase
VSFIISLYFIANIQFYYFDYSLDKYIKYKNSRIAEDIVWKIFYEIVLGVQDIHKANIAHLDLKPSNILIDDQGFIKIGDFGISVQVPVVSNMVNL